MLYKVGKRIFCYIKLMRIRNWNQKRSNGEVRIYCEASLDPQTTVACKKEKIN